MVRAIWRVAACGGLRVRRCVCVKVVDGEWSGGHANERRPYERCPYLRAPEGFNSIAGPVASCAPPCPGGVPAGSACFSRAGPVLPRRVALCVVRCALRVLKWSRAPNSRQGVQQSRGAGAERRKQLTAKAQQGAAADSQGTNTESKSTMTTAMRAEIRLRRRWAGRGYCK